MTAREIQSWPGGGGGKYPSCLWHGKRMPREEGEGHSRLILTGLLSGSAFVTDQSILYRCRTKCWLHLQKQIETHKDLPPATTTILLLRAHVTWTPLYEEATFSNRRKFWYSGTEDKHASFYVPLCLLHNQPSKTHLGIRNDKKKTHHRWKQTPLIFKHFCRLKSST